MIGNVVDRLKRAGDRLAGAVLSRGLVLVYHRVGNQAVDPWNLAVTPEHFAEHLDILRRSFRPGRLEDIIRRARAGSLQPREVTVTFDDGYADNLYVAKPLLERNDIPATVFVATGALTDPSTLWWDALQRLLVHPEQLPPLLDLEIDGHRKHWVLSEASSFTDVAPQTVRSWHGLQPPPHPRLSLYQELWHWFGELTATNRRSALEQLAAWAGRRMEPEEEDRPLGWDEVEMLAAGNLIAVGAHSVTHARLTSLPLDHQEQEIRESRAALERATDRPVTAFAYPHGGPSDFDSHSERMVQEAGFNCACAAFSGVIGPRTNPFRVPRLYMENWDGETFARLLRHRFGMRTG